MRLTSYLLIFILGFGIGFLFNQYNVSVDKLWHQAAFEKEVDSLEKNEQIQQVLKKNKPKGSTNTLAKTKQYDNYHPTYLMQKADTLIANAHYLAAIDILKDLFFQVDIPYNKTSILSKINRTVFAFLDENSRPEQRQNRILLLENILDSFAEEGQIRLRLIEEYIKAANFDLARYHLQYLEYQPTWQVHIEKIKQNIIDSERFVRGAIAISLIADNNSWWVNAKVQTTPLRLLLDTGANLTIIKERFINNTDLSTIAKEKSLIQTANGTTTIIKAVVKEIAVGSVVDKNFTIGLIADDKLSDDIDGLLGTDWLNRFRFEINQSKKVLILRQKLD